MYMAIAVETFKHPEKKHDYKIWYLDLNPLGDVIGIGVKSRQEVVKSVFENYQKYGHTNWRAFKKDSEQSTPIEFFDFIAQNAYENTHFGNLPTLNEFQQTINCLQMNMEFKSIA